MSRVLLAWELGGGFGHLARLAPIGAELKARGHACAYALRFLGSAEAYMDPALGPRYQAPVRVGPARNPVRTQTSYASLLHNIGFDNPDELAGRIRAWRDLMRILRTEALVADHSPIALIAARSLGIKAMNAGNGFSVPPLSQPFPSFRPRMKISQEVLSKNEDAVLAELNTALKKLRIKPYKALQEIFQGVTPALLSYGELDHYQGKRQEQNLGRPPESNGAAPQWPTGRGPKLFAHVRGHSTGNQALLLGLSRMSCRVLIRAESLSAEQLQPFARPGLDITDAMLDFSQIAKDCDAYVGTGSHGLCAEMLLQGKPGLLLPQNHEQRLLAMRLVQAGAALMPAATDADLAPLLDQLFEDDRLREAATRIAKGHARQDRTQIIPELLDNWLN